MKNTRLSQLKNFLWDAWCALSIVGIWPRFIEPYLLQSNTHVLSIHNLPDDLKDLHIVQLSDLHITPNLPDSYLKKLSDTVASMHPDLIVFTGDFLCYSRLESPERLKKFLNSFSAKYGCFAIYGNHDYSSVVTLTPYGEYKVSTSQEGSVLQGIRRLLSTPSTPFTIGESVRKIGLHKELTSLLQDTPFTLLHNDSHLIPIKNSYLNVVGLGEYTLGKSLPDIAFKNYNRDYPGLILTHNPDSLKLILDHPGDLILCGHTHGAQINIPWVRDRIMLMENKEFVRGLYRKEDKWIYVSRGVGSTVTFRLGSRPEIPVFILK